jgi:hypothetical protein
LSNNDADNLKIGNGVCPLLVADLIGFPASWPDSLEERSQVSNGEKDVALKLVSFEFMYFHFGRNSPLQTQSCTREHGIFKVPTDRRQRVLLHHSSDLLQFLQRFGIVNLVHERNSLTDWEISPVDTLGSVAVVWMKKVVENSLLVLRVVGIWVRGMIVTSLRAVRYAHDSLVGGIMVLVVVK